MQACIAWETRGDEKKGRRRKRFVCIQTVYTQEDVASPLSSSSPEPEFCSSFSFLSGIYICAGFFPLLLYLLLFLSLYSLLPSFLSAFRCTVYLSACFAVATRERDCSERVHASLSSAVSRWKLCLRERNRKRERRVRPESVSLPETSLSSESDLRYKHLHTYITSGLDQRLLETNFIISVITSFLGFILFYQSSLGLQRDWRSVCLNQCWHPLQTPLASLVILPSSLPQPRGCHCHHNLHPNSTIIICDAL